MPKLQPLLNIALILFLSAGAVAAGFHAAAALRTHAEIDYGEGIVLWQAANVTDWKKAYHPVEEYPHIVFHYPPLFHLTSRFLNLFAGDLLTAGRVTSILSLAGTSLMAGFLVWTVLPHGGSRLARFTGAFTAATLFFATPVWWWALLMRVDTLAFFLSICGIALFVLARRRPVLAFLSFACFVAAVYTKQTSIAAPAACIILAFVENPRRAVKLLGFSIALGLIVLVMLHIATNGLILRHLIFYNQNPQYFDQTWIRLKPHCIRMMGLLFFAVVFPFAVLQSRVRSSRWLRLTLRRTNFERCVIVVALYFWIAAAIASATISKFGAFDNYFLEMDIAVCVLCGLFVGWLGRRISFQPRRSFVVLHVIVIVIFLMQTAGNWRMMVGYAEELAHPPIDYSPQTVTFLKQLPDPIYSEDMVILIQAGKEIPAEPAIITALALDNKWDERGFVSRIQRGDFSAIVISTSLTNRGRFTEAVANRVLDRYYLGKQFGKFQIYLPR